MFSANAKFNGLSSAIYRNRILQLQLKILAKILSVICTHMVDFRKYMYTIHSNTRQENLNGKGKF